jgi:hypothetical protein
MPDLEILNELKTLTHDELKDRFSELYDYPAPKQMSHSFLCRVIAYRLQENENGGTNNPLRQRLRKLAKELKRTGTVSIAPLKPTKAGTRFLREWQGETHIVSVTERGFLYREQAYRSLSAVAREITGTRWSGPAFFGLKDRKSQKAISSAL